MAIQPLVSVIIPIYNTENELRCCLDSVLAQTYENLEILLIDDGSTDGAPEICDAYAKRDPRIAVIHQENGGLSAARNAGIDRAQGEYLTFLDSDDFLHRRFVEYLLRPCVEQGAEVSVGDFMRFFDDASTEEQANTELEEPRIHYTTGKEASHWLCDHQHAGRLRTVVAWGKLISREVIAGIRFPDAPIYEDEATCYRYLYRANKVAYVFAKLYFYRYRPGSAMTRKFSDEKLVYLDILEERTQFYRKHGDRELAGLVIRSRYGEILRYVSEVIQAGKKNPERMRKLHLAMARLYKDALWRGDIPRDMKQRYFQSIFFLKTAYWNSYEEAHGKRPN